MRSIIYWNHWLYWKIYGRGPSNSVEVSRLIPAGASVLDLCCGGADLYIDHLRAKGVRYRGIDLAPRQVRPLLIQGDMRTRELPTADLLVEMKGTAHR